MSERSRGRDEFHERVAGDERERRHVFVGKVEFFEFGIIKESSKSLSTTRARRERESKQKL